MGTKFKDTILALLLSLSDMILLYNSVLLLFIPHVKWYNVHRAEIQSTVLHLIEILSRQFLGNSPKIANQMIFLLDQCHSKVEKSGGKTMEQNTRKSDFFCMISTTLTKTRDAGAGCFIL